MEIHSIGFDLRKWTPVRIKNWFSKHPDIIPIKQVHITKNFARYRIRDPKKYKRFVTKKNKDIMFVFGIK